MRRILCRSFCGYIRPLLVAVILTINMEIGYTGPGGSNLYVIKTSSRGIP